MSADTAREAGKAAAAYLNGARDALDCLTPIEQAQWMVGFVAGVAGWSVAAIGRFDTETALKAALSVLPDLPKGNGSAEQV